MFKPYTVPNERLATREEVQSALRVHISVALVGHALFAVACYITHRTFATRAPAEKVVPWAIGTAIFLGVWLALEMMVVLRRPSTRELIHVWVPTAKAVLLGSDVVVVASIWLFLPHADQATTLMMMVFYACHIPTQVRGSP